MRRPRGRECGRTSTSPQVTPVPSRTTGQLAIVDGAAVTDLHDRHDEPIVLDLVQHAVIAHPDTERAGLADNGPNASWSRIVGQGVDGSGDPFANWLVEFPQYLVGGVLDNDLVSHWDSEASFGLGLLPGDDGLACLTRGSGRTHVSRVGQFLEQLAYLLWRQALQHCGELSGHDSG